MIVIEICIGESGGGNLAIATALKAKEEGCLHIINGLYISCPFISGFYGELNTDPALLPSLTEYDGMFINSKIWAVMADLYNYSGADHLSSIENQRNYLAWPYWAQPSQLVGLPPHVVVVNELDGLKDEGLHYYRSLLQAGVSATSFTINGTCHAADLIFRKALPNTYFATLDNIRNFANRV